MRPFALAPLLATLLAALLAAPCDALCVGRCPCTPWRTRACASPRLLMAELPVGEDSTLAECAEHTFFLSSSIAQPVGFARAS